MTGPGNNGAAPSPFAPIANYGFLSNCHTGALVAPDGATGGHLGNFPQAFSHLALVEAAARLVVAEGRAEVAG